MLHRTALLVVVLAACAKPSSPPTAAVATIASRSASTATGTARVTPTAGGVTVTIAVEGASPGDHGLHLHVTGDCSAADATSAGDHWNPAAHAHGAPGPGVHAGDLGNITVDAGGRGTLVITLPGLTLGGATGVLGHAIVLHAAVDDLQSQPAGNAGARIGCGVIVASGT